MPLGLSHARAFFAAQAQAAGARARGTERVARDATKEGDAAGGTEVMRHVHRVPGADDFGVYLMHDGSWIYLLYYDCAAVRAAADDSCFIVETKDL